MDFLLPEEKIKKHSLPEVNAKAIGTVKDVSLGMKERWWYWRIKMVPLAVFH